MKDKYSYRNEREDYETLEPGDEVQTAPKTRNGVICNHPLVRIRTAPNSSVSSILTAVPEHTYVTILGDVGNYYQIEMTDHPGRALYVSKEYCKEV